MRHEWAACVRTLVVLLFLAGCATGPTFSEAPAAPTGTARLYIYRLPSAVAVVRDARFYIDDQRVAVLSADGYSYVAVKPGRHLLEQGWPFDMAFGRTLKIYIDVKPGETRYFRFSTGATFTLPMMNFQWELTEVSSDVGRSEIARRHFQQPETTEPVGK